MSFEVINWHLKRWRNLLNKIYNYTNGTYNLLLVWWSGMLSQILEVCVYNPHTSEGCTGSKGPAATLWLISPAEIELVPDWHFTSENTKTGQWGNLYVLRLGKPHVLVSGPALFFSLYPWTRHFHTGSEALVNPFVNLYIAIEYQCKITCTPLPVWD